MCIFAKTLNYNNMKILSGGKKDFYDYLSGIYGIDDAVVYDRTDGYVFRPMFHGDEYFIKERLYNDRVKKERKGVYYINGKHTYGTFYEGINYHFVIEVGFMQYLFFVERYLDDNGELHLEAKLLDKFRVTDKKSKAPISVIPVDYHRTFSAPYKIWKYDIQKEIQNPILTGTWATSFLPAEEVYNEIYNYLISIKEPKIIDKRNDVQKLESHGFDKKSSFRNPIIKIKNKKK